MRRSSALAVLRRRLWRGLGLLTPETVRRENPAPAAARESIAPAPSVSALPRAYEDRVGPFICVKDTLFKKIVFHFKYYVTKSILISIKTYEEEVACGCVRPHVCVCVRVFEGSRRMD